MAITLRTKEEQIALFELLAHEYGLEAQTHRTSDEKAREIAKIKSDIYELVAYELKYNME